VLVDGDLVGKVLFFGEGAGAKPTSSAVIADVVSSARKIVLGVSSMSRLKLDADKRLKPMSDIITRFYVRMNIADARACWRRSRPCSARTPSAFHRRYRGRPTTSRRRRR